MRNLIRALNELTSNVTGLSLQLPKIKPALTKLYYYVPKNLHGFEHGERIGLALALHGQNGLADDYLQLLRNLPTKASDMILLISLLADMDKLRLKERPKMNAIGKIIRSPFEIPSFLPNIGQRSIPIFSPQDLGQEQKIKQKPITTFEEFLERRFGDIRSPDCFILNQARTSKLIQSILCGQWTDYTDTIDHKIVLRSKVKFEFHTLGSTQQLLNRFIAIGNNRIKLALLLRRDSISYEIRRHLAKFDAYVSTLVNNSPAALLTKIRPFEQVFVWLERLLSKTNFTDIHKELLISSQTHFKYELSLHLWSISFEEAARPLYSFAFLIDSEEVEKIPEIFEPIAVDYKAAGILLNFLHDTAPSHPLFELCDTYMELFLALRNHLKEFKRKCEREIMKIEKEWIDYHNKVKANKLQKFLDEKIAIRNHLEQMEARHEMMLEAEEKEKRDKLNKLRKEMQEHEEMVRERINNERENDKALVDKLIKNKSVTPIFRPHTDEEQRLIELEKLDLFMEFKKQMEELGASEEKIMSFFPELNLPYDELEALEELHPETSVEPKEETNINNGSRADDELKNLPVTPSPTKRRQRKTPRKSPEQGKIEQFDIEDELKQLADFELDLSDNDEEDNDGNEEEDDLQEPEFPFHHRRMRVESHRRLFGNLEDNANEEPPLIENQPQQLNQYIVPDIQEEQKLPVVSTPSIHEDEEEKEEEEKLTTIPALFYRLVLPSFKIQYRLVSKALFSILKNRDQVQLQIDAISKLFLIKASSLMDTFVTQFTSIPYSKESPMTIEGSLKIAAKELNFDGRISIALFTTPPETAADVISFLKDTPITIEINSIFSILLPDRILDLYSSIFRILLLLKMAKAAIAKMWFIFRDSYFKRQDALAPSIMSRFVVAAETYFNYAALTPAAKALEVLCENVETIEECNNKHEEILRTLMRMSLVASEAADIRTPLLQALTEIIRYAFGPLMLEKGITMRPFVESAQEFAVIVHDLNEKIGSNQALSLLDTLFIEFL